MAENKSPAFQFYAENFLNGTAHMTPSQVGIYIRLLCHQWHFNGLPNDDKRLMQMTGGKKADLLIVREKFNVSQDGLLRNNRMEQARRSQEEFRKKASEAGKKSARLRQGTLEGPFNEPTNDLRNQKATLHSSSSSSSSEVQQHQHPHEVFAQKIFTEQWRLDRENIELQLVPRRLITEEDVREFNRHLKTEEKNHVHRSEYLKHLRNWLNTKPNFDKEKAKNHESNGKNRKDRTIGRISEPTVTEFLNRRKSSDHPPTDTEREEQGTGDTDSRAA